MKWLPTRVISHKRLLFVVIVILIASFFGFRWYVGKTEAVSQTAQVSRGSLSEVLTLSGDIDADEKVTLHFQSGGLVSWIGVKKGDTVKKYQAIASLDKRQLQNSLNQYLNTYIYNRNAYDQAVANTKDKVFTDDFKRTIDQSRQTMNNAVLTVELQTLLLQLATITTPIDGIITELGVTYPQVNVSATTPIASVVNPNTVYFDVSADQTEVVLLEKGKTGTIVLDAYPEKEINAVIADISFTPKTDETGTMYQVKMDLGQVDNSTYLYKLGMTGDATFTLKQVDDVLILPSKFVKTDENSRRYVLMGEKKEKVIITTGIEDGEQIEVKGAIKEGDIVYD